MYVAAFVKGGQQGHTMALLQLYDVDLFDFGLAVLSDKTQEEIERLANQRVS